MRKNIIILKLAFLLSGTAYTQERSIVSLLPESNFYKNLNKIEVSRVFNNDDLYEIIDGGADIFIEYGFNNYIQGTYASKKLGSFMIEIYEMSDIGAALGIFSILQIKEATKVDIGNSGSLSDYFFTFYKNNFFIRISVQKPLNSSRYDMQEVAKYINAHIPGEKGNNNLFVNHLIKAYDIQNCIYFRGNIAFSNIYFFHSKNIFDTHEGLYIKQDEYDFIVLHNNSENEALETVNFSRKELEIYNMLLFENYKNGYTYLNRKDMPIYILAVKNFCFIVIARQEIAKKKLEELITINTALLLE